jgi:hypothetical protein
VLLDHVMRLIEQDAGVSPRALFVAPVRVLGWDDGIHIRADLRIAEHGYRVPDDFQQIFQALTAHGSFVLPRCTQS